MTLFIWFLIGLTVVLVGLVVLLLLTFVRLGKEIQQLSDDTEVVAGRMQRTVRTVQLVAPAIALLQRARQKMQKKSVKKGRNG